MEHPVYIKIFNINGVFSKQKVLITLLKDKILNDSEYGVIDMCKTDYDKIKRRLDNGFLFVKISNSILSIINNEHKVYWKGEITNIVNLPKTLLVDDN